MKKHFLYFLFLLIPVMNRAGTDKPVPVKEDQCDVYANLHLSQMGLTREVFQLALKGYRKLEAIGKLQNVNILTIVDFSQSSKKKRLYVIDMLHKVLLFNTLVAHGRNTGDEFAKNFSNVIGSFQSSLGFYITREKIMGSTVGLSLLLEGMEQGFNDNALKREIIIHGAAYASESFITKTGRLGRSYGCPSLPPDQVKPVVESIKEGTCLFIYQHDDLYLSHSSLLN